MTGVFRLHHFIIHEANYLSAALHIVGRKWWNRRASACQTWALPGHPKAVLDAASPVHRILSDWKATDVERPEKLPSHFTSLQLSRDSTADGFLEASILSDFYLFIYFRKLMKMHFESCNLITKAFEKNENHHTWRIWNLKIQENFREYFRECTLYKIDYRSVCKLPSVLWIFKN